MKSKDIKKYYELIKEAEKEIQQKNHIKALDLFDKAIAIKSGIATVYFYKAELLFTLNRDIEATRLITSLGQIEDNLAHTYTYNYPHLLPHRPWPVMILVLS